MNTPPSLRCLLRSRVYGPLGAALRALASSMILVPAPSVALAEDPVVDPHPDTTFAAVVIGISAYDHMPEEVELDFARSDAATVAGALRESARYDRVELLTDRNATKAAITETLRERLAQHVGARDVLLVYFVGHGIGSDLGQPTLLAHDSTVQNGQDDGFDAASFARDLATWTRAGTTVLVTDAIHRHQLDGISFQGPAADEWPAMGPGVFVVSATRSGQAAIDGAFGHVFAEAISGASDANADGSVTVAELEGYLDSRFDDDSQTPDFAGTASSETVIAKGVIPGATSAGVHRAGTGLGNRADATAARDTSTPRASLLGGRESWNVDLLARTDFPVDVGLAVDVETPERFRFGLAIGVVPGPYIQAVNAICVAAGCYDTATATLIEDSIRGAFTVHPVVGFRPHPRAGFVAEAGFKLALLGGANTPAGLVAGLTGEAVPDGATGSERALRAAATVGMVTANVGWLWEPKRSFVVRLDVGGAFTVFSETTILAPEGTRIPRAWEPLTAAGETYLDTTLQTYVHTPTVRLSLGWRGL